MTPDMSVSTTEGVQKLCFCSQVFKLLRCVCENVLSQLSTSLGEDEEVLRQPAADECMHAAISWRASYKRYTYLFTTSPFSELYFMFASWHMYR